MKTAYGRHGWVYCFKDEVSDKALANLFSDADLGRERYDALDYLHNTEGPAVYNKGKSRRTEYYLNGEPMDKQEWEIEVFKLKFSNKLEDIINS